MRTRVANLVLAFGNALVVEDMFRSSSGHRGGVLIAISLFAPVWLAAALGLFFKSRVAWGLCVIGVGTMLAASITSLGEALILMPTSTDPSEGVGALLIVGTFGIIVCLPVAFGMIRMRGWLSSGRLARVQPDGPANVSQPIYSETNSTSGAAGSRR